MSRDTSCVGNEANRSFHSVRQPFIDAQYARRPRPSRIRCRCLFLSILALACSLGCSTERNQLVVTVSGDTCYRYFQFDNLFVWRVGDTTHFAARREPRKKGGVLYEPYPIAEDRSSLSILGVIDEKKQIVSYYVYGNGPYSGCCIVQVKLDDYVGAWGSSVALDGEGVAGTLSFNELGNRNHTCRMPGIAIATRLRFRNWVAPPEDLVADIATHSSEWDDPLIAIIAARCLETLNSNDL